MLIPRRWPHTLAGEHQRLQGSLGDATSIPNLEAAVATLVGSPHAVCMNSGRQGMTLILKHVGISQGDEVVVPAYTLGALIPLVESLGATAVPADISIETMNVTAASVEAAMSDRTRGIIVLHAFGAPAPVDEIAALAASRNVPVVEDCAHSLGATLHGQQTGTFGYAGFYSFEITKPVNTYGGGMVVTRDASLDAYIRRETAGLAPDNEGLRAKVDALRTEQRLMGTGLAWPLLYLLADPRTRGPLSALYRSRQRVPSGAAAYTPMQAQLGLEKLPTLNERIAHRAALAARYRELLDPSVKIQEVLPGATSTWYFLVAVLPCAAAPVRLALLRRGIDTAIEDEIADDVAAPRGYTNCPNAAAIASRAIALPMYETLHIKDVDRVCRALNRIVARA